MSGARVTVPVEVMPSRRMPSRSLRWAESGSWHPAVIDVTSDGIHVPIFPVGSGAFVSQLVHSTLQSETCFCFKKNVATRSIECFPLALATSNGLKVFTPSPPAMEHIVAKSFGIVTFASLIGHGWMGGQLSTRLKVLAGLMYTKAGVWTTGNYLTHPDLFLLSDFVTLVFRSGIV